MLQLWHWTPWAPCNHIHRVMCVISIMIPVVYDAMDQHRKCLTYTLLYLSKIKRIKSFTTSSINVRVKERKRVSVRSPVWLRLSISWCHALEQLTCCQSTGETDHRCYHIIFVLELPVKNMRKRHLNLWFNQRFNYKLRQILNRQIWSLSILSCVSIAIIVPV